MKIEIKKVRKNAIIPEYKTIGAAGVDLCACIDSPLLLTPETPVLIPTGIAVNMGEENIVAFIVPRSGLGFNHGVGLMNTIGVIDSDYQGEIMIKLRMSHGDNYRIQPNERIAQLIFMPIHKVLFNEVTEFSTTTDRGDNGFGSTGK